MKRHEFFKELGDSLYQTVKTVYDPFVQSDIDKLEEAADLALGLVWIPIMKEAENADHLEMKFFQGKAIIIVRQESNMQAWNGICPVCSNIITLTTLYLSGKCLNCRKEYNFKTNTGDLQLRPLPIRRKKHMIEIAHMKGDDHA
jgi:hypothetical protein